MTGAKEAEVEVRKPATIGDNSGELPIPAMDDWSSHYKAIRRHRALVATAQGNLRNVIKAAKKAGIDMKALDLVASIENNNDPKKAVNYFQQIDLGLQISEGSTLRITVHDTLAGDEESLVEQRGYLDGKAGRNDNGYPEGSDLAQLYQKGWMRGQTELLGESITETPKDSEAEVEVGAELDKAAA